MLPKEKGFMGSTVLRGICHLCVRPRRSLVRGKLPAPPAGLGSGWIMRPCSDCPAAPCLISLLSRPEAGFRTRQSDSLVSPNLSTYIWHQHFPRAVRANLSFDHAFVIGTLSYFGRAEYNVGLNSVNTYTIHLCS